MRSAAVGASPRNRGTIAQAIRDAAEALAAISPTSRLDAELLMAEALGTSRSELLLRRLVEPAPPGFAALLARRARAEPIAYILGRREFHGLELVVTPAVLIPRCDSETLIEAARAELAVPPRRILDLGTGSGALLLASLALWPAAEGIGSDRSPAALAVARANAARLGSAERTRWLEADWNAPGWADRLGRFELVLANPPYVEAGAELARGIRDFEPAAALYAGADGLDAYRALVPQLPGLLVPGGAAVLEIGATQAEEVASIATASALGTVLHRDLAGLPRALVARV